MTQQRAIILHQNSSKDEPFRTLLAALDQADKPSKKSPISSPYNHKFAGEIKAI
jgi:hypothetical protein